MSSSFLQQLSYENESENATSHDDSNPDICNVSSNSGSSLHRQQDRRFFGQEDSFSMSSPPSCDNGSKLQLQNHEREQHLHQLQSINNMLLDLPGTSPTGVASSPSSYSSSKFSSHELPSPTPKSSASFDDLSVSGLFGLKYPRGSLVGTTQKEQAGQSYYESSAYRNYSQLDNSSGYLSNSNTSAEQQDCTFYSNSSNMEVPSSPISVHTPGTPGTPGSAYSNPYSTYSSLNSSPYTSNSSVSNGYINKQYTRSPIRSPPSGYGRPIRGSPPYSDCSSPSTEYPSRAFGCNGSRSDSPADSENSTNSIDGSSLSDIMRYLSISTEQQRYQASNQASMSEAEKYFQSNRAYLQKLRKYLVNSHQQLQQQHQQQHQHQQQTQSSMNHYSQNNYGYSRNQSIQTQNNPYMNSVYGSDKCSLGSPRSMPLNSLSPISLDKAVKYHRNAAAVSDAKYTWSGTLPAKAAKPIGYSPKVFLGGLPYDADEYVLINTFKQFGQIKIDWPGKDQATTKPKGYVYIIFESEKQVKALLANCTHDFSNGGSYYYKISTKRMKGKDVQVIPWSRSDTNYVKSSSQKLDASKTVFVGALHGMMHAAALAKVFNDLFDNVIYVGIDTDRFFYPIGSCRITFSSKQSYLKAITANFIEIKTSKFGKVVQVEPYLEEAPCSSCYVQQGNYFCREPDCFKYYCHTCWQWVHNNESLINWHKPMSRGLKNQVIGLTPSSGAGRSQINVS